MTSLFDPGLNSFNPAVVPILVGPLQALLALLPAILMALGAALFAALKPSTMKLLLKMLWRQKIAVIVVIAAAVPIVMLIRAGGGPQLAEGVAELGDAEWPTFRGTPERLGADPASPDATVGGLNWNFSARDARTFYSSPTVVGNRLYAASAEMGIFTATGRGSIYCLDADTGGLVWSNAPDGYRATFSSPSISDGYLVIGEGLHYTRDARIVCMDAETGKVIWTYRTNCHVESSPAVSNGRVVAGAGDDGYYCLDLKSGELLWHVPTAIAPDAESPPLIIGDRVYVGLGIDGDGLLCLDLETGEEIWRVDTPNPVFTPPSYSRGSVFIGMGTGNFVQSAEEVREIKLAAMQAEGRSDSEIAEASDRLAPNGEVWRIDAESGEVIWKFQIARIVLGAVVLGEDRIFFGSKDGNLYSLDYDGREIARWNARSPIVASPALGERHIYIVTTQGALHALEADALTPVWSERIDATGPAISSPTLARGQVYIGSSGGGLYSFGSHEEPEPPVWKGFMGGPGRGGSVDDSRIPPSAVFAWRYPAAGDAPKIVAPPAISSGRVVVPIAEGAGAGLAALRAETDSPGRSAELLWTREIEGGVWESPAANDGRIFAVSGPPGSDERALIAVASDTGQEEWRVPIGGGALESRPRQSVALHSDSRNNGAGRAHLSMVKEALFIQDGEDLLATGIDGNERWRARVGALSGPAAAAYDVLLAATTDGKLIALDRPLGAELWRMEISSTPMSGPVPAGNIFYIVVDGGVEARRVVDGSLLWRSETGAPAGALIVEARMLIYSGEDGRLVALDRLTGERIRAIDGASPSLPPTVSRGAALFNSAGGIMRVDLPDGEARRWMQTAWLGEITAPPVAANGFVYFPTERMGLVCVRGRE